MARAAALASMVVVNFDVVMAGGNGAVASLLQGRAAALFVVLAGVGFQLSARGKPGIEFAAQTLRRSVFLLVVGLLNMLIFPADIIHYYAIYFLVGVVLAGASSRQLWLAMIGILVVSLIMLLSLNYDVGWNWETLEYSGFWSPGGFVRNLMFNGWHPVFPWAVFLLFGMWLAELNLRSRAVQVRLLLWGAAVYGAATLASRFLVSASLKIDSELSLLFATSPVPPVPLYMIVGSAFACAAIGTCLLSSGFAASRVGEAVVQMGWHSLTHYIAHIVIGMGAMEAFGLLDTSTAGEALLASLLYIALALSASWMWSRRFKRGPLEALMRATT